MPESNAEKVHRIVGELARIRNELKELVREGSSAAAARGDAATRASNDPLEEILGSSVSIPPAKNAPFLDPEAEDVIVVDVLATSVGDASSAESNASAGAAESLLPNSEKRVKDFPKKPPPRKRK